jgi:hypothetical protein
MLLVCGSWMETIPDVVKFGHTPFGPFALRSPVLDVVARARNLHEVYMWDSYLVVRAREAQRRYLPCLLWNTRVLL